MSVEIQWTDVCPKTGAKRFVNVERFAGQWHFKTRYARREDWKRQRFPSREMWEELLDSLERRYHRREGVTDLDLKTVKQQIARLKPAPVVEMETETEPPATSK